MIYLILVNYIRQDKINADVDETKHEKGLRVNYPLALA